MSDRARALEFLWMQDDAGARARRHPGAREATGEQAREALAGQRGLLFWSAVDDRVMLVGELASDPFAGTARRVAFWPLR